METAPRKPYPSDVSDDEWAFATPYLTLLRPDAPQRVYDPREVFNAVRWMVQAGSPWRYLPTNFPPWEADYQQIRRWMEAGCFDDMVHDLRAMLRWADGRTDDPTAVILDRRTWSRWSARARHPRNGKIVERADDAGGDAPASWHADRRISSYRSIEVGVDL
jgi:transposase